MGVNEGIRTLFSGFTNQRLNQLGYTHHRSPLILFDAEGERLGTITSFRVVIRLL